MTDDRANVDDSEILWKEFRSQNGRKYEVGYPKKAAFFEEIAPTEKKDFGVAVSWPVGDGKWQYTTSTVRERAAITRYSLYESNGTFKYTLYFTNTEHYNYYFYDETGDGYQVNTYRNGDHFVRYDSDKPDIVFVRGS